MPVTPNDVGSWNMTTTNLISIGTVVANLAIAFFNAQRSGAQKRLEHFNSVVRRPCEARLEKIDGCHDDAEDFIRDPIGASTNLDQISRNFHTARRALERTLQDAQKSDLIPGDNWLELRDDECDLATEALDAAMAAHRSGNSQRRDAELQQFRQHLTLLRGRIQAKVDTESGKAIAFRLSWW